jgi:class 3 adenylate cyclase
LNDIFSRFDKWVDLYGLEKIKTSGDSYMVVGGLPLPQRDHPKNMASLAVHMQREVSQLNSELHQALAIRIGIHIGPVVAGVIGTKKFSYDVWGDTVNTASRLESHGIDGQIQVSKDMYEVLKDDFTFEERGLVELKGKGEFPTYLLKREK